MDIQEHLSLQPFNTFGISSRARFFANIHGLETLQEALAFATDHLPLLVLGSGSNLLFKKDFPGLVMKIGLLGITRLNEDTTSVQLRIAAGENWHQLVQYCVDHGYGGIENLALIPGAVGAAPIQNIGAYGVELKNRFVQLEAMHRQTGHIEVFTKAQCCFGYRDSVFKNALKNEFIITSVTLQLSKKPEFSLDYAPLKAALKDVPSDQLNLQTICHAVINIRQTKLPDPKKIGNAGSFFKNPIVSDNTFQALLSIHPTLPHYAQENNTYKIPAAWLIEHCGFKGHREGHVGVHHQQALVLVNHGGGTGEELVALANKIQAAVEDEFGIVLVPEVNII